jgi:hypothetical protein
MYQVILPVVHTSSRRSLLILHLCHKTIKAWSHCVWLMLFHCIRRADNLMRKRSMILLLEYQYQPLEEHVFLTRFWGSHLSACAPMKLLYEATAANTSEGICAMNPWQLPLLQVETESCIAWRKGRKYLRRWHLVYQRVQIMGRTR